MKSILYSIIVISLFSCNDTKTDKVVDTIPVQNPTESSLVIRDTCINFMNDCLHNDSCIYQWFYDDLHLELAYVKTGNFIFGDKLSGIIIYTPTDSTIAIEHFIKENEAWQPIDAKIDMPTDWLTFETDYQDYNFDGIIDVYLNVGVMNGSGLSYGYLLTIDEKGKFKFHPESAEIKNMDPDPKRKIVWANAVEYCKEEKIICDEIYTWKNDTLTMVKRNFECK
jgi:hypothetical protein